jgi:hypothetical protein
MAQLDDEEGLTLDNSEDEEQARIRRFPPTPL